MEREQLAKETVFRYLLNHSELGVSSINSLHLVWFAKVLKNWKALVMAEGDNQLYFEVTYNGDTEELYLDVYNKLDNAVMV